MGSLLIDRQDSYFYQFATTYQHNSCGTHVDTSVPEHPPRLGSRPDISDTIVRRLARLRYNEDEE